MAHIRHITLVGAGNLAQALGPALKIAGCELDAVVIRANPQSRRRGAALAKKLGAALIDLKDFQPASEVVWLCHTDDALSRTALLFARTQPWEGKIVLHSSGALSSEILAPLRKYGASTASVHPMMTFVPGTAPEMAKAPFAVEGERKAVTTAKRIVKAMGAESFEIQKEAKVLYHALGSFSSPLIVATLATAERVGRAAGLSSTQVAKVMRGILQQTITNYLRRGPAMAFSGPIKRGDLDTVRKHLKELHKAPGASEVYRALVRSALIDLPAAKKSEMATLVGKGSF